MVRLPSLLLGVAAASGLACAAEGEAGVLIEPVIRLAGGEVVACGVSFRAKHGGAPLTAEFLLQRGDPQPEFVLSARYGGSARIYDMSLIAEGGSTSALLPRPPQPRPDGSLETKGPLPGEIGSELVRSLMVSGGRLVLGLTGTSGGLVDIELPGPFPQQVRAGYLACAGDLVGPAP